MAHPTQSSRALVSRLGRRGTTRWALGLCAALVLTLVLVYAFAPGLSGGPATSHAAAGMQPQPTHSITVSPAGPKVAAHWSKTVAPQPAAEAKAERAATATLNSLKPPTPQLSHQPAVSPARVSPPVPAPTKGNQPKVSTGPLGDTDFAIEQQNLSNTAGNAAYPCTFSYCSNEAEPSVADDGACMLLGYNYYDSYSCSGGAAGTWSYLDPNTFFSSSVPGSVFCCDQQVIYEPSRNTMWWELRYGNGASPTANPGGILLATDTGTFSSAFCPYYLTGGEFAGGSNGDFMDNPDVEFTNDNMFLTFDLYSYATSAFEESVVLRMALTPLSSCGTFSGFYTSGDSTSNYHFALTQGAQGTMWFVSDTYLTNGDTGSDLFICQWQDPQGSPFCANRAVPAFNYYYYPALSANCASTDGVVSNWCSFLDSSARSVFFTKANFRGFGPATLGVALSVGPAGGDPYPWVAIDYFEVASLNFVTEDAFFNDSVAYTTPSFAANFRGFIGFEITYGGGTSHDYYPAQFVGIFDPTSPTPPFQWNYYQNSHNMPYVTDYNTVRPMYPSAFPWIGATWLLDGAGNVYIGEIIWDRGRDHNAYLRWYLS